MSEDLAVMIVIEMIQQSARREPVGMEAVAEDRIANSEYVNVS